MSEYELVEFIEPAFHEGGAFTGTHERLLGQFGAESDAIEAGRKAWSAFRELESNDVAWWIVRVPGETLARWIADSGSAVERVLDLRTNQLIDLK
ncbi:MAG TPA: hypothetical protein VFD97_05275 [Acidimicrobiia bacterium]|nr:hypothetical protein [Acidimicrobiia bacterium]